MFSKIRNRLSNTFKAYRFRETSNPELNDPIALIELAQKYYNRGVYIDAIKCYNKAIKLDPKNHRILTLRAMAKSRIHKFKESINDLKKVVFIDPNDGFAWHGLAENYFETNELALSKESYDKAIECGVTSHNVYFMRGKINYAFKQFKEAYDDLTTSIEKESRLIESYVYLGLACSKLGLLEEELNNYDQAIRLGSKNPAVYFNRGMVKLNKSEIEKAKADFFKASEMGFKDADMVLDKWDVYVNKHK